MSEELQNLIGNLEEHGAPEIEILQGKIDSILDSRLSKNQAIFEKIDNDNKLLEDYIILLGENSNIEFIANGQMYMNFDVSEDDDSVFESFKFHDNALMQLGDKFDIPRKYVKYLNSSEWGRKLLKDVFTEHMKNCGRKRLLVRTVGNQIRGILSDKYRRLNSNDIYEAFIKGCKDNSAVIYEAFYSETKTYISALLPRVFEVDTENNGKVYTVFGVKISNSDFGNGALDVRKFQMNVICLNGLVSNSQIKQVHLGARLPENIRFSNETYIKDTEAMASATYDVIKNLLNSDSIIETCKAIRQSSLDVINIKNEITKLPKLGMVKEEVNMVSDKLLENNISDGLFGRPSKWKLAQAISAVGNDIGDARKHELDEIAGKITNLM